MELFTVTYSGLQPPNLKSHKKFILLRKIRSTQKCTETSPQLYMSPKKLLSYIRYNG
jgi:hypothetical protein